MPHMTGVELLSEVRQRSPDTVRILLTGYADLESIEGSINDGEVFRFLTKPCQAAELRATIGLAAEVAADTSQSDIASAEVQASAHAPAATVHRTVATARPVPEAGFPKAVLLFSSDSSLAEMTRQALPADTRVYVSANLVEVIETLEARQPGVLVTDVSGEREVIEQMTMQLKQHVPELVTVVASEFSDSAELIRLINCGQVFRYLRKPVTPGRLRVSVNAAVSYHQRLVADPGQMQRHVVNAAAPPAASAGGMLSSIMTRIHHLGRSWRTG
jgi:DNA-binding NtrC family response regulator